MNARFLDAQTVERLAEHLESAERSRRPVAKITDQYPEIAWTDAYAIQSALRLRKEARGVRVVGLKMGLTSRAKMKQMGVEQPVYGFLTNDGAFGDGADIDTGQFIHPRVEAEIAVITSAPLHGPGCNVEIVRSAIDFVVPAVEVIDSRYLDFKFDLKSVIADNTSAAAFVIGGRMLPIDALDVRTEGVVLVKNGTVAEVGAGAAVLGNPLASVAMLANMLADKGEHIPSGSFIMTGGITAAIPVASGDNVMVHYQSLGTVRMRFV